MARYGPQSQNHQLMAEKRRLAQRLLHQGLTVRQISTQLRCSQIFVRRVRTEMQASAEREELAPSA